MVSNPAVVACASDTWVKVATNVTVGTISRVSSAPSAYLQTYRVTGDPAPANNADAVNIFATSEQWSIEADAGIDVYIKAVGAAGSVRVDL